MRTKTVLGLGIAILICGRASGQNGVLVLDAGGHVEIPHNSSQEFADAITVECWLRIDSAMVQELGRPISKRWGSGGMFSANICPRVTSGFELFHISDCREWYCPTNQWVHFASTWSNVSQIHRIYLNGEVVSSVQTAAVGLDQYSGPLCFGDPGSWSHWNFQGRLDNIRIWRTERTRDQIRTSAMRQFTAAEAVMFPDLVGSWTFNDLTATDGSGVNNGVAQRGADFAMDPAWTVLGDCNGDGIPDPWQDGIGEIALLGPVQAQAVLPGAAAIFVADVSGPVETYQWQKDGEPMSDTDRIHGTSTATLRIDSVSAADEGMIRCIIQNECSRIVTDEAPISCKPIVTSQPPSHAPLKRTLQLAVGVPNAAPYSYRWQRNGIDLTNAPGTYSGTNTRTLRILSPDFSLGGTFTCRLTDVCGDTLSASSKVCLADFNADELVDDGDFVAFANSYDVLICESPSMSAGCPADFNNDTVVDDSDFVLFVTAYNELLCP